MMKHIELLSVILGSGIILLGLLIEKSQPPEGRPNTVAFLGITNGIVGPMTTTYQTFSTNHAAQVQQWLNGKTNAAIIRITNNQNCRIWIFPFARIESKGKQGSQEVLLLDAPNYSGIPIPARASQNVQIALFSHSKEPWRIHMAYTREENNHSVIERLKRLPRDLKAYFSKQPIVENTIPMITDWIEPSDVN